MPDSSVLLNEARPGLWEAAAEYKWEGGQDLAAGVCAQEPAGVRASLGCYVSLGLPMLHRFANQCDDF